MEQELQTEHDRFDEANKLRERFSELEEAKTEKLAEKESANSNSGTQGSMAIKGWVERMVKRGSVVDLEVSYVVDGEQKTEEFTVDFPEF